MKGFTPLQYKDIKQQTQVRKTAQKQHAGYGGNHTLAVKAVGNKAGNDDPHSLQGYKIQQQGAESPYQAYFYKQ